MASVVATEAYGQSVPSESDAKAAIENVLGGCRFLSLENFKKINGIANYDGSHILEVKYTIKATASTEVAKMVVDYSRKLSEISARLEKAIEADNAAKKESTDRAEKLQHQIKDRTEWNSYYAETEKFNNEVALPANQAVTAIQKERNNFLDKKSDISQKFKNECPSIDDRFQYLFYDNNMGLDNYTKDFTRDYHQQILMIKTDNGWMPAN
jgi:hypothetical protein